MSERFGRVRRSLSGFLLEVGLIGLGVFFGLWANDWHESQEHRALAANTLRNFDDEMHANEETVQRNRDYHETLAAQLATFSHEKNHSQEEFNRTVRFLGVRPAMFEHTALDLALATQALSYLPPDLAFSIARVYTKQRMIQTLEDNFLAGGFTPGSLGNPDATGFAASMQTYLGDINVLEPEILSEYRQVIPEIERARTGRR